MFSETSRYSHIGTETYEDVDEKIVPYVRRRFLPRGAGMPVLTETDITEGDRLDLLTAKTLGDPQQYWRICDANDAMNPKALVSEVGRRIRVPIPTFEGFEL